MKDHAAICEPDQNVTQNPQAIIRVLEQKIKQLERDNRMMGIISQNTSHLWRSYESEKKLQYLYNDLLLSNCPNMIFLFNTELRFVLCSRVCQPLLAVFEENDLAHRPFIDIFSSKIDPEWVDKVYRQNQEVLQTLKSRQYDDTILFQDDSFIHAQLAISPIVDDDGVCHGTVMTINDITELTIVKQHAEAAAHSKSNFLANMSHEIRTPMNAVKGLSELLALTELDSMQRNYVNNIISSSNSLLGIINDVLDFSKIDAQKIEFIEAPYSFPDMITSVCNVVNMRADNKDLLLLVDASPDLPMSMVGDEVRIKQVLTNLLTNAVKYTHEGTVRVVLSAEPLEDNRINLTFSVQDTGVGIREEDLHDLFDAFSRADLRANRNIAGTGLGLAISKHLVVAMGGTIWVESEHGKGSAFTFQIPQKVLDSRPIAYVKKASHKRVLVLQSGVRLQHILKKLSDLQVEAVGLQTFEELRAIDLYPFTHLMFSEEISEGRIHALRDKMPGCRFCELKDMRHAMALSKYCDSILYYPLFVTHLADFLNRDRSDYEKLDGHQDNEFAVQNANLLVVDDNEINLIVSGEMLRALGADVTCAPDGNEAIALCNQQIFDIIFMDHMMPGRDGVETTLEIRASSTWNQKSPIVALTANVANDMRTFYLENGFDDFLAKPVDLADLSQILAIWLPPEKIVQQTPQEEPSPSLAKDHLSPEELIAGMDNFGLFASDVLRELDGSFERYVARMDQASQSLKMLLAALDIQVAENRWDDFSRNCKILHDILHGIGARDCAGRAHRLSVAGKQRDLNFINEDFFSLMGNLYMLEKKLAVIVPLARGASLQAMPLNVPQYLSSCLQKLGDAIAQGDRADAITHLATAAAFSLDSNLDAGLKQIKAALDEKNLAAAQQHHIQLVAQYTQQQNNPEL